MKNVCGNIFLILLLALSACTQSGPSEFTAPGLGERFASIVAVSTSAETGTYSVGQTLPIYISWSEAVNVEGVPVLSLDTGEVKRFATFVAGSGTDTLTFLYTVQTGDEALDLNYQSNQSLSTNGGKILTRSNREVDLALPDPSSEVSLGKRKIKIYTLGRSFPQAFTVETTPSSSSPSPSPDADSEPDSLSPGLTATLSWTAEAAPIIGYLIVRRPLLAPTWHPEDGVTYTPAEDLGDNQQVIYVGPNASFLDTGLTDGTIYYYKVVAYDADHTYSLGAITSIVAGVPSASPSVSPTPTPSPSASPTPTPEPVVLVASCTVTASPKNILLGASSTLTLRWSNASSGTLNGITYSSSDSRITLTPSASTLYTATVTGPNGNATCSVQVNVTVPVAVTKTGSGSVTASGISCGFDCGQNYAIGTSVTFTATPSMGYTFDGWSGACSGSASTCTITIDAAKTVTANFRQSIHW